MSMFVKFWGVRGSIPTPGPSTRRYGGNTSCVEVRTPEAHFICDAGSGMRELGLALSRTANGKPLTSHLMLSHAHWDHIQGFPFFGPVYSPTTTLRVYGTDPGDDRFFRLLSGQMGSDYFPVQFSDLAGRVVSDHLNGGCRVVGDTEVSVLPVCHPGGSLSYRFRLGDRMVVYSTDNELDLLIENPEDAHRPEVLRRLPEDLVSFVRGADLLIADGQYTDVEYPNRVNWGHSRASTCIDLALAAGVKQVAIFHHDPMQSDADVEAKIQGCRRRAALLQGSALSVFGAREGVELRF
ncbi:MAG TPA: hypothetical protein DFR83_26690 [Deltaproteobacteria bacterium]|nr:hypothetical protein [Deltaproteobacteria bacterium]